MLFNFAPSAPASNWFQGFLLSLVKEALESRANGSAAKTWAQMLTTPQLELLRARHGLRSRYKTLVDTAAQVPIVDAVEILDLLNSNSLYNDVLSGGLPYQPFQSLPEPFSAALEDLFDFSFDLLDDLKAAPADSLCIRDRLYTDLYNAIPGHYCPFCGIDRFDAPHPDMPRHALDHYLAISIYPLFGAHLPNLVPMCGRCNSSFKLAADMLVDDNGAARRCVDPYGNQNAKISLKNSQPFGGAAKGLYPIWVIDFVPADEAFETWATVFKIRLRYKESLLDAEYRAWLDDFGRWAAEKGLHIATNQDASDALLKWAELCPTLNDFGFLKKPVFEMLAASAASDNTTGHRVTSLVRNIVTALSS